MTALKLKKVKHELEKPMQGSADAIIWAVVNVLNNNKICGILAEKRLAAVWLAAIVLNLLCKVLVENMDHGFSTRLILVLEWNIRTLFREFVDTIKHKDHNRRKEVGHHPNLLVIDDDAKSRCTDIMRH